MIDKPWTMENQETVVFLKIFVLKIYKYTYQTGKKVENINN